MEISGFELFAVPPRWVFLKVTTDDGIAGWGEPVVEERVDTIYSAIEELFENYLLGKDPLRIHDHWQAMYKGSHYRGGPILMSAIAGIDQALWDIKGKHFDVPVYELLGGRVREKVPVYQWVGGETPEQVSQEARTTTEEEGFTAIKMDAVERIDHIDTHRNIRAIEDRIERVRETVADNVGICVDFRGRVSKSMAKRMASRLDRFDLLFVEEPIPPEHTDLLETVAAHTTTPLATGERMYSKWEYKPLMKDGTIDVIQPDISHAGGITEVFKIAVMAEAFGVSVSPIGPHGPISLAAALQVDAAAPNLLIQDGYNARINMKGNSDDYFENPPDFGLEEGYVTPLDGPGLGIEINEEVVRDRTEEDVSWHIPVWRHLDGSVAEW